MEKAELKELIAENNLQDAIIELGKILYNNEDLYNLLISIRRRYSDAKWDNHLGVLGREEWNIEINKITVALNDLIDRLEKSDLDDAKIGKREIKVEEAIEWLQNFFREYPTEYDEEKSPFEPPVEHYFKIDQIDVAENGEFLIIIYEADLEYHQQYEQVVHYNKINKIIKGKFQDISKVVIKDNDYPCVSWVECQATNFKNSFNNGSKKLEENEFQEMNKSNTFRIPIWDNEFAKKVRSAFDYLAIHFGRKEDAF